MSDAPTLLEASGVGRRSETGESLLAGITLRVRPGERWGITGATGAGKSLFLRALALLDPIDEGRILWQGREIEPQAVPGFRRQVIYLHQRPALLEGTVESNLMLPFRFRENAKLHYDRSAVVARLVRLGRDASFLDRKAQELSGGESQIVALLRAIQLDPHVLLLDEPTAAMDPETAAGLETLINVWYDEQSQRRALLWVSHDARQVERVTHRRLRLHRGRMQE